MAKQGGRTHALLSHIGGGQGDPFLPKVGQMYLVDTLCYFGDDPAAARPAVVFEVPPVAHSPVRIITRTHQLEVPGVQHPADKSAGCNLPGVFSDLRTVEQSLWRSPNVELIGELVSPYLEQILDRFR